MSSREWKLRITEMARAIAEIQQRTTEMDFSDFHRDRKTVDAVIRNFIISEAACHVPDPLVEAHPEIPWRDTRDMRNVIVHEYFGINDEIVWETIRTNLLPLVSRLGSLL